VVSVWAIKENAATHASSIKSEATIGFSDLRFLKRNPEVGIAKLSLHFHLTANYLHLFGNITGW